MISITPAPTFTIQDLVPIAIVFVVTVIVLGFGASVVQSIQTNILAGVAESATCNASAGIYEVASATGTGCGYAYTATQNGLSSLNTFGSNLPLLATIVIAAIIISVLIVYLSGRMMKG